MKIKSIILKDDDVVSSVKEAAINTSFAYSRLYQVLHKQFWLKDRLREEGKGHIKLDDGTVVQNDGSTLFTKIKPRINTLDYTLDYNGRAVKAILFYNIENMSMWGYDPQDLRATGIASLFNEQKPTQDLKAGGDDLDYDVVNLTLKTENFDTPMLKNPSWKVTYISHWEQESTESADYVPVYEDRYLLKYNPYGDVLIDDVIRTDNYENVVTYPNPIPIVEQKVSGCESSNPIYSTEETIIGYEYPKQKFDTNNNFIGYEEAKPIYGYEIIACSVDTDNFIYEDRVVGYNIPEPIIESIYKDTTVEVYKDNIVIESFNCDMTPFNSVPVGELSGITYGTHKSDITPHEFGVYKQYNYYIKPVFDSEYGTVIATRDVKGVVYKVKTDEMPDAKWHHAYTPDGFNLFGNGINAYETDARIYILSSGLAIQVIAPINFIETDGEGYEYPRTRPPSMTRLPLMYEDTGDLVMNRFDFVEDWSDMFEVYVHNYDTGPWWKPIIGIVIMFVIVYLTYDLYLAGTIGVGVATSSIIGTVVGTIGSMSGNRLLQGLGIVLSLYSTYQSVAEKGLAQSYQAQGLTESTAKWKAKALLMEQSFGQTFSYFLDGLSFSTLSGMSNMLSMANSTHGLLMLTEEQTNTMSNEELQEAEEKGSYYVEEDEDDDIVGYINSVIDLSNEAIL